MQSSVELCRREAPAGNRKVRVGIAGTGYISDFHIRALKTIPWLEVAAVGDTELAKAEAAARRFGIEQAFPGLEPMIADASLDAVHLLLPPSLHARNTILCLEAGCHVFVEKPLATSSGECEQIRQAALRFGRTVGVNCNSVYHPAFRRLLDVIRGRQLGQVQHVTAFVNVPLRQLAAGQHGHWMFRESGNIILEQAPHPLAQIQHLLGRVQTVAAVPSGKTYLKTGVPFYDTWQVAMVCERGTAQCFLSFGKGFHDGWLHVVGEDGSALVDLRRNTIRLVEKTRFMEPVENLLLAASTAYTEVVQATHNLLDYALGFLKIRSAGDPFYQGMAGSIHAWHGALREGSRAPGDLEDAAEIVNTCETIGSAAMAASGRARYATHA